MVCVLNVGQKWKKKFGNLKNKEDKMDLYIFGFLNACFGAIVALVYQRLKEKYKGKYYIKEE